MIEVDVLVVGGGPAGVAAANAASRRGLAVALAELRPELGGALFRRKLDGAGSAFSIPAARHWARLVTDFEKADVRLLLRHGLAGVDSDGLVMLEDRAGHVLRAVRARSLVLATGAVERTLPVRGAELPGVMTIGALQLHMKRLGEAPEGPVLLAGSGPLLIAAGAQMARLGRPPVAILERGQPMAHPLSAFGMLAHPAYLAEAAGYLTTLSRCGVPWLTGAAIRRIEPGEGGLVVEAMRNGRTLRFSTRTIGLHDGIRPNDYALPPSNKDPAVGMPVLRAGDCREALGGRAAIVDGAATGERVADLLQAKAASPEPAALAGHRRAQGLLRQLFSAPEPRLDELDEATMLCRCEGGQVCDLKALLDADPTLSAKEIRLNGRFAMGACRGRFCAENVARLAGHADPVLSAGEIAGTRWPSRPIAVSSFLAAGGSQPMPMEGSNE